METDQKGSTGEYKITADHEYRKLFEESSVPMYVYSEVDFSFLAVNNAALQQYGYTKEEFLSLSVTDIRPPEEKPRFLQVQQEKKQDFTDAGQWRHQRKNGDSFIVHIYAYNTSHRGVPARMVSAVDISHKVQMESEDKLKAMMNGEALQMKCLLESITDGFFALDRKGIITYINKEFEQLTIFHQSELVGRCIFDIFPLLEDHAFGENYHKALQEGVTLHFEEYFPPFNTWLAVNGFPTADGVSFYFHDITRERQIQEKLQKEEAHLRSIINTSKDIIWSVDHNLKIITANDAFWERLRNLTGKSNEEMRETDLQEDVVARWKGYYERAFNGESFKQEERSLIQGSTYINEVTFHPIYDKEGKVIGVSCFSRQIN